MTIIRTGSSPFYWSKLPKSERLKGRQVTVDQSIYLIRNEMKINMRRENLLVMSKTNKSGDNLRASKAKWYFFLFAFSCSLMYSMMVFPVISVHDPETLCRYSALPWVPGQSLLYNPKLSINANECISEKWGICYKQSVRKRNLKDTPYKQWTDLSTM